MSVAVGSNNDSVLLCVLLSERFCMKMPHLHTANWPL